MEKAKKGKPSGNKGKTNNPRVEGDKQDAVPARPIVEDRDILAGASELQDAELLGRVRDLEAQTDEVVPDTGLEDIREEGGFFSVVRELEEEIDATLSLKDSLEADLEEMSEKFSQESAAKIELVSRVKLLESQVTLADQMRQELSFVEEERDRASSVLVETRSELDSVTDERNALAETSATAEAQNRRLEAEKSDLETHVAGLNEKIAELELLSGDLEKVSRERDVFEEKVKDLRRSLETSDSMVETLQSDLNINRDLVRDLRSQIEDDRAQIEDFKEELAVNGSDLTDARTELDAQSEVNKRLGDQVKTLTGKYRAAFAELETARKAMRSIQKAAIRVRERTGRKKSRPSV